MRFRSPCDGLSDPQKVFRWHHCPSQSYWRDVLNLCQPTVRYSIELPHSIAVAVNLQGLRGRARDHGISDYACECGHGKDTRRFIWHLHCGRDVAELLLEEIERARKATHFEELHSTCTRVAGILRAALEQPATATENGRRIVNTICRNRSLVPTIADAAYLGDRPDPAR